MASEEDYFIAADLTLYSNPLNKALDTKIKSKTNAKGTGSKNSDAAGKGSSAQEEQETIAADMTKYDSPMADLDKRHTEKQKKQERQGKLMNDWQKKDKHN